MSPVYIACKVLPGLFESEYYVLVNGSSAYYIHRDNVKITSKPTVEHEVDGQVLAYIVEKNGDKALVQLPGEPVVGGIRTWVESQGISAV